MSWFWRDSISDWSGPGERPRFSQGSVIAIQPRPKMTKTMWINDSATLQKALRWLNQRHREFWEKG